MNTLAVIIPAYKPDYLQRTLCSLSAQSCQAFSVYIGDDASPFDLSGIIAPFNDKLDIHYTRFQDNVGGKDLVSQWERCVGLCEDEDFIILFSDDDMMEENCIASIVHYDIPKDVNVLHFDIDIINENDECIQHCPSFPESLSASSFFDRLFRRQIVARMPEFVFRREWLKQNGIVPFNLAWRSDTATVIKASLSAGIRTVSGNHCRVLWRASDANISGNRLLAREKNESNVVFFNWLYAQNLNMAMSRFHLLKTIVFALEYQNTWQFVGDGIIATFHLQYALHRRLLMLLFIFYRIPYHFMELYRS